jgi:hypothetical protein
MQPFGRPLASEWRQFLSGLEWMALVAPSKQCPTVIMAPDSYAATAKAYE